MRTSPDQLWELTAVEAIDKIAKRQISAVELVKSVLDRFEQTEPSIHAFVSLNAEQVLSEAADRDRALERGVAVGQLHGLPVAIKDIYDVAGVPTRCGSQSRENASPATADARSVARLRAAGAIILGKTVTQEYAAGVISEPARNPWDPDRIPGGSSGGSAAAVVAGSALAAMGSDTGGSIRIPASVCGAVGLKPTIGTVSLDGVFPLSWSLDTAGPITRSVADAALLYSVLRESEHPEGRINKQRYRIGVPRSHFFERLQLSVERAIENARSTVDGDGIEFVDCDWPDAVTARACSFIINRVETSAVHYRNLENQGHLYADELRRRVRASAFFPAAGYADALQERARLKDSMACVYGEFQLDALAVPTLPGVAALAEHPYVPYPDGSEEHVSLAYTRLTMPFNITGQPVLSLPCGYDGDDLPIGLQLAGKPYQEPELIGIGTMFESRLQSVVNTRSVPI